MFGNLKYSALSDVVLFLGVWTHLIAVVGPGPECEVARLPVKGKVGHIHHTCALSDGWRVPDYLPVIAQLHVSARSAWWLLICSAGTPKRKKCSCLSPKKFIFIYLIYSSLSVCLFLPLTCCRGQYPASTPGHWGCLSSPSRRSPPCPTSGMRHARPAWSTGKWSRPGSSHPSKGHKSEMIKNVDFIQPARIGSCHKPYIFKLKKNLKKYIWPQKAKWNKLSVVSVTSV